MFECTHHKVNHFHQQLSANLTALISKKLEQSVINKGKNFQNYFCNSDNSQLASYSHIAALFFVSPFQKSICKKLS